MWNQKDEEVGIISYLIPIAIGTLKMLFCGSIHHVF